MHFFSGRKKLEVGTVYPKPQMNHLPHWNQLALLQRHVVSEARREEQDTVKGPLSFREADVASLRKMRREN
jgi:hypothetical protein